LIRRYPRLCVFAYEYFVFLGRITNPSSKPPILGGPVSSLLRPVRLGRPYQEQKVPANIARKVIEARKPPPPPPNDKVETMGGENDSVAVIFLPPLVLWPNTGHGLLILEVSRSHKATHHSR